MKKKIDGARIAVALLALAALPPTVHADTEQAELPLYELSSSWTASHKAVPVSAAG